MNEPAPHLPDYGDSGDFIGARRTRRAFRWGVALVVAFTALLWVTESFWRYPPADRLYRSALTLLPEQGRNLLRQAVKYDALSVSPSSKYYEALAEREEEDLVVAAYENASKLDPQNADLAIKFGCELFRLGLTARAREQFRLAADSGSHNALAVYLEAALLPRLNPEDPDVDVALSLVKQANNTGDVVAFPRPMWFPVLPREGYWYAQLRRQIAKFCGAPLEGFASDVLEMSERKLQEKRTAGSMEDLQVLETMGRRIASSALEPDMKETDLAGGLPQLYLGLRIMSLAVQQEKRVATETGDAPDEAIVALGAKLEPSLRSIEEFERSRQEMIEAERAKYGFPWILAEMVLSITLGCFLIAYIACKALRVQGPAQSVRHSAVSRTVFAVYFGVQLFVLLLVAVLQRSSHGGLPAQTAISILWYATLAGSLIVSVAAPALTLPGPADVLQRLPAERRCDVSIVRGRYRTVFASLVKRYLGVQFGLTLCVLCVWIVVYRIFTATYPWMLPLLITGMESEEIALIRSILANLG